MIQRPGYSEAQRAEIQRTIAMLEQIYRTYTCRLNRAALPALKLALERFPLAVHTLAQWDDDRVALEFWEQQLQIASADVPRFRELITVPPLEGEANWTGEATPLQYLGHVIRDQKRNEVRAAQLQRKKEVPLEAFVEPMLSGRAERPVDNDQLIRAVLAKADAEVREYGELALRGYTEKEIRRKLGWYKKRVRRVEMRYRRYLKQAAATSATTLPDTPLHYPTDASKTTLLRTFADPASGARRSYFEHKAEWKDDPKDGPEDGPEEGKDDPKIVNYRNFIRLVS
jgi:hypothetical protein